MIVEVRMSEELSSPRLQKYIHAMTEHVLVGFEQDFQSVSVQVFQQPLEPNARRFHCVLRVRRAANDEFVLDESGSYPHVAVERALESLWQILRDRRDSAA